jgi:hypothetical protein
MFRRRFEELKVGRLDGWKVEGWKVEGWKVEGWKVCKSNL